MLTFCQLFLEVDFPDHCVLGLMFMKCHFCDEKAVVEFGLENNKPLCKNHFVELFEKHVFYTFDKYHFLDSVKKISVATSGGKDSVSVLYLTKKYVEVNSLDLELEALIIDEGIVGYRNKTLDDLKRICQENSINLKIISFKQEFGVSLDEVVRIMNKKRNEKVIACSFCGTFRRYLLNKYSRDADVIITGHNLDDEVQSIVMNFFKSNVDLLPRLGIINGVLTDEFFTPRVKPFYFCKEKEIFAYSILKGFGLNYTECPYAKDAYRENVRSFINDLELDDKNIKYKIAHSFLKILPDLKQVYKDDLTENSIKRCNICNEPSSTEVCRTCSLMKEIKS